MNKRSDPTDNNQIQIVLKGGSRVGLTGLNLAAGLGVYVVLICLFSHSITEYQVGRVHLGSYFQIRPH